MRRRMLSVIVFATLAAGCAVGEAAPRPEPLDQDSARPTEQASAQVFEMRTYTTHPGKLDDLHRRFRDHTTRYFARHGITNVAYWVPQDSARRDNTLIYIIAYPSREEARRRWAAFQADPEWRAARAASEANGAILQRVESVFMDPTDYSPMK